MNLMLNNKEALSVKVLMSFFFILQIGRLKNFLPLDSKCYLKLDE